MFGVRLTHHQPQRLHVFLLEGLRCELGRRSGAHADIEEARPVEAEEGIEVIDDRRILWTCPHCSFGLTGGELLNHPGMVKCPWCGRQSGENRPSASLTVGSWTRKPQSSETAILNPKTLHRFRPIFSAPAYSAFPQSDSTPVKNREPTPPLPSAPDPSHPCP